jgi:hypothetical protein
MTTEYPFSVQFGRVNSRDACAASAAIVYDRLVGSQSIESNNLKFSTLAIVASSSSGKVKREEMKNLVEIFRPNKDKELTLVDFIRVRVM